jgi:hypothetical protein
MIQVSSIIKVPLLYSLVMKAELIQVTSMTKNMQIKVSSLGLGVSFLTSLIGLKDGFGLDG